MKKIFTAAAAMTMAMGISMTAYAGSWQQDDSGWWWRNDNGTYPTSSWQWLDGNHDGRAECYYFNEKGYCLTNTVISGKYQVNQDGAWIVNGVIQRKDVAVQSADSQKAAGLASEKNQKALAAYRDILTRDPYLITLTGNSEVDYSATGYMVLFDINGDGIQELYVYVPGNCNAATASYILYYTDRLQISEPLLWGGLSILPEENSFVTYYYHQGLTMEKYSFDGTVIRKEESIYSYAQSQEELEELEEISDYYMYYPEQLKKDKEALETFQDWEDRGLEPEMITITRENIDSYLK